MAIRYLSGVNIDSNTLVVDDVNNRVGIGTASPGTILEVSSATPIFRISSSLNSSFHGIEFRNGGALDAEIKQLPETGEFRISNGRNSSWGGFITLYTDTAERIRITSAGNVGIGTTSPSEKLDVNGNGRFLNSVTTFAGSSGYYGRISTEYNYPYIETFIDSIAAASWDSRLVFRTNSNAGGATTGMVIDPFGKVGIGTTSPAAKLTVSGTTYLNLTSDYFGASTTVQISSGGGSNSVGILSNTFYLYPYSSNTTTSLVYGYNGNASWGLTNAGGNSRFDFYSYSAGSSIMSITSSGNVGIGTTSPSEKLHVYGNLKVDGQTFMTSGFSSYTTDGLFNANALWNGVITPSGVYRIRLGYLDQGGGQYWGRIGFVANTNWSLGTSQGGNSFSIGTGNGNNEFLIDNAGNVGVGTTSPGYKLDVAGAINSTTATTSGTGTLNLGTTVEPRIAGQITAAQSPFYTSTGKLGFSVTTWGVGSDYGLTEVMAIDMRGADSKAPTIWMNPFGGNVGIGITSPTEALAVNGNIETTIPSGKIGFDVGDSYSGYPHYGLGKLSGALPVNLSGYYGLTFGTEGSEKVRILGNGNVGIGTTSPGYKLDVAGSINTNDVYRIGGNTILSGTTNVAVGSAGGTGSVALRTTSGDGLVLSGSSVGIGTTSPADRLYVGNTTGTSISISTNLAAGTNGSPLNLDLNFRGYADAKMAMIRSWDESASTGDGYLTFWTNDYNGTSNVFTEKMRIGPTGSIKLNSYGSGSNTGTATQRLAVDASGNVIEIPIGSGPVDGNGTANYVTKWSDTDTITNSIIYDNGTNVGIGTTSPGYKLEVVGGSVNTQIARFITADYPTHSVGLGVDAQSTYWGASIFQDDVKRFTVDSTGGILVGGNYQGSDAPANGAAIEGNVGIGTTSPSTKLDVIGTGVFGTMTTSRGSYSNGLSLQNNGGQATSLFLWQSGVASAHIGSPANSTSLHIVNSYNTGLITDPNAIVLDNTGNVGIGTTSPSSKLQSNTSSTYNSATPSGAIIASNLSGGNAIIDIGVDTSYLGYIQSRNILNTTAYNLLLNPIGGNVGIGTTSPSSILDASLSGGATSGFRFKGWSDASTPYLLSLGTQTYPDVFQVKSVNGLVTMGVVGATGAAPDLVLQTNTTERMRITSAGNVGIGTTSPVSPLDVNGIISSRGIYIAQNSGTYNLIYNASNSVAMYLGGSADPANYYDNTTHYFRSSGGGTYYAIINSSGNVGINTTSPSYKLDVRGNIFAVGPNGGPGIIGIWEAESIASTGGSIVSDSSASGGSVWTTNGNYQLYGPYTNLPRGNYRLSVRVKVADASYTGNAVRINAYIPSVGSAQDRYIKGIDFSANDTWEMFSIPFKITGITANNVEFYVFGLNSQNITVDYLSVTVDNDSYTAQNWGNLYVNGNVGIGTTSPESKLHVAGGDVLISNGQYYGVESTTGGNYKIAGLTTGNVIVVGAIDYTSAGTIFAGGDNVNFTIGGVAGSTIIKISSSGNVGIGTTSPGTKLHVVGYSRTDGGILVNGGVSDYREIIFTTSAAARWNLYAYGAEGGGNAGSVLNLARYADDGSYLSGVMTFLRTNGYVGVNTGSPSEQLHVTGNVRVTGAYYDSNNEAGTSGQVLSSTGSGTDWVSLSEITGVDGTGTANYVAKWSDTDTITNSQIVDNGTNVGINNASPKTRLDVNGAIGFGSKSMSMTDTFATALTVNMNDHNGCYVKITAFGDWANHSTIAYLGEFFLQASAGAYNEPGIIIRQVDNTGGGDDIQAQIVDPAGTGTRDFVIQLKSTSSANTPFTAVLQYEVRGMYNSVS